MKLLVLIIFDPLVFDGIFIPLGTQSPLLFPHSQSPAKDDGCLLLGPSSWERVCHEESISQP